MKQVLKKVLPKPVLQQAVIWRDKIRLNLTPQRSFSTDTLGNLSPHRLSEIFLNPDYTNSWEAALRKIAAVYGKTAAMGGVNPGDRRALYYLVLALKPQKLLEVGTHIGASTVFFAEALANISSEARMTTVDILDVNDPTGPWYEQGLLMPPRQYLEKLELADRVSFSVSPSSEYLKNTEERFDFIFLDGDHSSSTVYEEVSLALEILNPGGVILLHDYYPQARPLFNNGIIIAGPFMAMNRITRENPKISVLPLGELPWTTKNNLKTTSLALVIRES